MATVLRPAGENQLCRGFKRYGSLFVCTIMVGDAVKVGEGTVGVKVGAGVVVFVSAMGAGADGLPKS